MADGDGVGVSLGVTSGVVIAGGVELGAVEGVSVGVTSGVGSFDGGKV